MEKTRKVLNIKKLGIIMNPKAGRGGAVNENVATIAAGKFKNCQIIRPHMQGKGRDETKASVNEISSIVDVILVVGGDGTLSDTAYSLFKSGTATPILGVGAGSTNAGPLVSVRVDDLDTLDPQALTVKDVGGILALLNGEQAGLGFNDIVLGDTVLATMNDSIVQVSAADFMKGKKTPAPPSRVGTSVSEVNIERSEGEVKRIHNGDFGQLFAAPLEKRYLGKGLAGGTSLATALGLPAGIAITSEPLINYSIGQEDLLAMEPIVTKTASFRKEDTVFITGIREGTCLNVDGNPLALLGPDDEIKIQYVPAAVKVVRKLDDRD